MNTIQTTLTFFNQDDLAAAMPNLDGFNPSEMPQFRAEATEIINALQNMRSYAEAREMASDARLRGKIELAQRFESANEQIYKRLPEWAKW